MRPIVILAGLRDDTYDRITKESANAFAPNGKFITKPIGNRGYTDSQISDYLNEITNYITQFPEATQWSISLAYINHHDQTTHNLLQEFFPFALTKPIPPLSAIHSTNNNTRKQHLNDYAAYIKKEIQDLRHKAALVRNFTNVQNLSPLLLPVRNFSSKTFEQMLTHLFNTLGTSEDPAAIIQEEINKFYATHPRTRIPTGKQSCLSDGTLYFKSPGRDRHGFYRHGGTRNHQARCLLNARTRLGAPYDYSFHYDCEPVKGTLHPYYPNCHTEPTPPKRTHVNIAPNDFVI